MNMAEGNRMRDDAMLRCEKDVEATRLGVLLAGPLGDLDHVGEGGLDLGPLAGLETAVRVDEDAAGGMRVSFAAGRGRSESNTHYFWSGRAFMKAARRSFISWTLGTRGLFDGAASQLVSSYRWFDVVSNTHEWMSLRGGEGAVSVEVRREYQVERQRLTRDPGR